LVGYHAITRDLTALDLLLDLLAQVLEYHSALYFKLLIARHVTPLPASREDIYTYM